MSYVRQRAVRCWNTLPLRAHTSAEGGQIMFYTDRPIHSRLQARASEAEVAEGHDADEASEQPGNEPMVAPLIYKSSSSGVRQGEHCMQSKV